MCVSEQFSQYLNRSQYISENCECRMSNAMQLDIQMSNI